MELRKRGRQFPIALKRARIAPRQPSCNSSSPDCPVADSAAMVPYHTCREMYRSIRDDSARSLLQSAMMIAAMGSFARIPFSGSRIRPLCTKDFSVHRSFRQLRNPWSYDKRRNEILRTLDLCAGLLLAKKRQIRGLGRGREIRNTCHVQSLFSVSRKPFCTHSGPAFPLFESTTPGGPGPPPLRCGSLRRVCTAHWRSRNGQDHPLPRPA